MIDLVEWSLRSSGIKVVKLTGSMPMPERRSVLAAFKTDPSVSVIILSLKAGGEGLNLQEATHVFVLEPWWNPQVGIYTRRAVLPRSAELGSTYRIFPSASKERASERAGMY